MPGAGHIREEGSVFPPPVEEAIFALVFGPSVLQVHLSSKVAISTGVSNRTQVIDHRFF
jgi:hypothetical protein